MRTLLARTLGQTIDIQVTMEPGVGRCTADRVQMESAILNLALNARDAMPGGGALSFEARRTLLGDQASGAGIAPGEYVEIVVRDNGNGMSKEDLEHAFEPFFTTKDVGKGSGLGLSMVYGFVRQSGGTAVLESQPGTGFAVRLFLPAAE